MKIPLKSPEEIALIFKGGQKLKKVLDKALNLVSPGVKLNEIEAFVWKEIEKEGGEPAFAKVPGYKWATCININDGIVHGIPGDYEVKDGDIVSVDVGILYKGWNTDMCRTLCVRTQTSKRKTQSYESKERFLKTGERALQEAINQVKPGNRIGHISQTIQKAVENAGYNCLQTLTGHGVGKELHEPPQIPCFLDKDISLTPMIKMGMVLAIEVIYTMGSPEKITDNDGWTIRMKDGKISAVFEKTIAVVDDGYLVCT